MYLFTTDINNYRQLRSILTCKYYKERLIQKYLCTHVLNLRKQSLRVNFYHSVSPLLRIEFKRKTFEIPRDIIDNTINYIQKPKKLKLLLEKMI